MYGKIIVIAILGTFCCILQAHRGKVQNIKKLLINLNTVKFEKIYGKTSEGIIVSAFEEIGNKKC